MTIVLGEADLAAIALPDDVIRDVVEAGLVAQATGRAIAEPTSVFNPTPGRDDLIAVIRGALPDQHLALVKTVGGFPDNADKGLPSNPGQLTLIETETGQVSGLVSAARITTERTAMVSAIGAQRLARPGAKVLACIGTRGVALQSIHYIARAMQLSEIRLHGRNSAVADGTAIDLARLYDIPVKACSNWESCLDGADIMIDGTALAGNTPLFPLDVIKQGALVIAYGAYSAMPSNLMSRIDRLVVDRWVEDGRGALGPHMQSGEVVAAQVDALIGDVVQSSASARDTDTDTVFFNHRGVAACDICLANAYLSAAQHRRLGTTVSF